MFSCCEDLADGDEDLDYECKTSLPGGGTCIDEATCLENYELGKEAVLAAKPKRTPYTFKIRERPDSPGTLWMTCLIGVAVACLYGGILYRVHLKKKKARAKRME